MNRRHQQVSGKRAGIEQAKPRSWCSARARRSTRMAPFVVERRHYLGDRVARLTVPLETTIHRTTAAEGQEPLGNRTDRRDFTIGVCGLITQPRQ